MTKTTVTTDGAGVSPKGDEPVTESGVSPEMSQNTQVGDGSSEQDVSNVEAIVAKKQQELRSKYEKDISSLRSSLQKQLSEQQKAWEQKEKEYRQKMLELQTKGLPEEEVRELRLQAAEDEIARLNQERDELEANLKQQSAVQQWIAYFEEQGIPANRLQMDGDLQTLINSGWDAITAENADLKATVEKLRKGEDPDDTGEDTQLPPTSGEHQLVKGKTGVVGNPTWTDLIKQYGSRERVYQLVEAQRLPGSIIPTEN